MKHLLSIFITMSIFLISCSKADIPATVTSTSLPASSVVTATLTVFSTNESAPTHELIIKEYLSCADSELIAEVVADFEARNGMTLDATYELARSDVDFGDEITLVKGEPSYQISTKFFYIGDRVVSGESLPGGKVKNIICAYGRVMAPFGDGTYATTPIPLGWEDMQGNFHKFTDGLDRATVSEEGDGGHNIELIKQSDFDSLNAVQSFLDNLPDGAIMKVNIRTFSRFSKISDIVDYSGEAGEKTKNLQRYLRMLGSQWADRNFNQDLKGIGSTLDRVDPEAGDQGLFSSEFQYWDEGNLKPQQ